MNSGRVLPETFSREDRLRKRREFEECYASGVRVSGRFLQLYARARPDGTNTRLGISVSRRAGNAVFRNRLRRRLKEIFRRNRAELSRSPLDLVVQCRSGAARAPFTELSADLMETAGRLPSRLTRKR